jgi:hypothetical protein
MAAPGNVRITDVHASRAAGGATGASEITSKTGTSLPRAFPFDSGVTSSGFSLKPKRLIAAEAVDTLGYRFL